MNRRNWLSLYRKLVDVSDMDYQVEQIRNSIGLEAVFARKFGVLPNWKYNTPLAVSGSGANMNLSVTAGMAHDPVGRYLEVSSTQSVATTAHATLAKWSLLVLRFSQANDTSITSPSNPLTTTYLNLLDSFSLVVIDGTPGAGAYPASLLNDVVLMGLQIPAAATNSNLITLDPSVRNESAFQFPMYSTTKRNQIGSPQAGMTIWNTTNQRKEYYNGTAWVGGLAPVYDAVVGTLPGCDFTDLASAIAAVAAGSTILVVSNLVLNATVTVNKASLEIDFKNGVTVSNGTAGTGISVTADGCRIAGAKFSGFTTAVSVDSTNGTACLIRDCRFTGNTNDLSDAGTNVTSYGLINA